MKKQGRIEVLLLCLTLIETSACINSRELTQLSGYSRTALFRLLRLGKDEFGIQVLAVRGKGYSIISWGVLNSTAVLDRHEATVKKWIEKKSLRK